MHTDIQLFNTLKYRIVKDEYSTRYYNKHNQLHREDGPAVILPTGSELWYYNGLRHRENGPAIVWSNGYSEWIQTGQRHRIGGPAVEYPDGTKRWFLYGKLCSRAEYHKQLKLLGIEYGCWCRTV